jgi:uncharacterized membrane protein
MGLTQTLGLRKRRRIMGLPIGPEETDWSRVAQLGAAAVGTGAAGTGAVRRARSSDNGLLEKGRDAVDSSKDLIEKGKETVATGSEIGERFGEAQEAMQDASTPFGKAAAAAKALSGSGGNGGQQKKQRLIIQEQIDIAVPRSDVYNQWTQFEEFPTFSRAVENVDQEEDETVSWQAKVLVSRRQWDTEIVEQIPDQRIVWESSGDVKHRGVVTFHELDDNLTRVQVEMEYEPTGFVEKFGNLFLTVRHRVRKDLRLFKHHLEFENEATGAWRGRIEDGETTEPDEGDDDAKDSNEESKSSGSSGSGSSGSSSKKTTKKKATRKKSSGSRSSGSSKKSSGSGTRKKSSGSGTRKKTSGSRSKSSSSS